MTNYKYTVDEVKENLLNLQNKLEDKDRDNIMWVIADRQDFRPLEIEKNGKRKTVQNISDIRKYLLNDKKKHYFIGKKIAGIEYLFDDNIINKINEKNYKKYLEEPIFQIYITINKIDNEGKIADEAEKQFEWELKVVFLLEDLLNKKAKYRDGEKLMRIVFDRRIITSNLIGIYYKNLIKKIKEKNIKTDFE
jgi:hypothetical protein